MKRILGIGLTYKSEVRMVRLFLLSLIITDVIYLFVVMGLV